MSISNKDVESKTFTFSKEELEQFHDKGYAGPFELYERGQILKDLEKLKPKLLNTKNSIYKKEKGMSGVTNISNYDRHLDVDFLAEHICRPEIVERVASIVGKDVLCWRSEFFPKYPGDEGTDWHQAENFAAVAGDNKPQIEWPDGSGFQGTLTVWTAFTDSTIENGCMQLMPGTHKVMHYDETRKLDYEDSLINVTEKNGVRRGFFGYDYRQLQKDPNWVPDESKAESIVLKAGQFIIFWSTLLHGSHPHSGKTQEMRLGYSGRYVPTCVKIFPYSDTLDEFGGEASLENHRNVLVSGVDDYGHNKFTSETVLGTPFNKLTR